MRHTRSERLWIKVGEWGSAPEYKGSIPFQSAKFVGRIEAFAWIDGRSLNASRDSVAVAKTLAGLHGRPIRTLQDNLPPRPLSEFIQTELQRYRRRNRSRGLIESVLKDRTEDSLEALRQTPVASGRLSLVHNDLVDGNVIHSKGRIWLIDWDWAMISLPCVDLYSFLSPFVRSWGDTPVYLSKRVCERFLRAYFACSSMRRSPMRLGTQIAFWGPYNTLLANWLYHEATHWPHTGKAWFYREAFDAADRLCPVIEAFK